MVCAVEVEHERLRGIIGELTVTDVASLLHLHQHDVAAVGATVGIAHGIEEGRILAKANQRGRLVDSQVFGLLIKIGIGRYLDAHGIVKEIKVVEI